jgi:hypothetical protein
MLRDKPEDEALRLLRRTARHARSSALDGEPSARVARQEAG